ncbi:hypothetical protein R3Q06_19200 [Rhodococcus erythropolis]|uniref:hypothetical protein n=1 Tax=Rhodococcus erythropolis TaxID=1833 RepID=UPI0029491492|nr:hypothetical protein [Rhodococcus erythropolis]MDV6275626.1 hypothetical protein [Rhodococcus erythropolis]
MQTSWWGDVSTTMVPLERKRCHESLAEFLELRGATLFGTAISVGDVRGPSTAVPALLAI